MSACPKCGAGVAAGDEFCEACGEALRADSRPGPESVSDSAPAAAAAPGTEPTEPPTAATFAPATGRCACGGTFDADGWCNQCGQRAPSERDHLVVTMSSRLGAVCDKGRHHPRNEDAVALAEAGGRSMLVVCDGVSSTTDSDVAAVAAANAARDVLAAAPESESPAARVEQYSDLMSRAASAANAEAVAAARRVGGENAPSCTFAAAVVDREVIVAGWVGDSRVYWLGDDETALQLSIDDSWVTDQVDHGMSRTQAEADPLAHSITRWLGADAVDTSARCGSLAATGAGWVLVCSDGLWNYCSGASDLADLITKYDCLDPTELAGHLVDWANEQGGHDNITVALARIERDDLPGSAATADPTHADAAEPQTRSS